MKTTSRPSSLSRPQTPTGRWSAVLLLMFILMFVLNVAILQQFSNEIYLQNPWLQNWLLPAFVILMLLCGLASGVLGILAIRQKERSWLAWFAIWIGFLVIFLVINEGSQLLDNLLAGSSPK